MAQGKGEKEKVKPISSKLGQTVPPTLRRLRLATGMNQGQIAERCGVTERAWRYWESGEAEVPSGRLTIIARELSLPGVTLTADDILSAWAESARADAHEISLQ